MKKSLIGITVILFLAVFLRFWDLKNTPPGLWSDEAVNGVNTIQALESGQWKVFYQENFGREGLFINIQALSVKALGHEPWVLRLPSAIFGVLTVLGLYFMILELFRNWKLEIGNSGGQRIALFSAFFLATSFWHINFSRIGFRAIMAPFFLVWGFYFLLKAIRKTQLKGENFSERVSASGAPGKRVSASETESSSRLSLELLFAIAGLIFGLGVHSYIAYRVAPFIALYPLWLFYKQYRLGKLKENICAPWSLLSRSLS